MKTEAFLYDELSRTLNEAPVREREDAVDVEAYVRQYTPLVRRLAHQMIARLPANVELDDMIQAGMMGLMDAAGRFEVSHGTHFEVYAAQRIRGAMLDELRANDWMPRSVRKSQRDIESATLVRGVSTTPRSACNRTPAAAFAASPRALTFCGVVVRRGTHDARNDRSREPQPAVTAHGHSGHRCGRGCCGGCAAGCQGSSRARGSHSTAKHSDQPAA